MNRIGAGLFALSVAAGDLNEQHHDDIKPGMDMAAMIFDKRLSQADMELIKGDLTAIIDAIQNLNEEVDELIN